MPASGERRPFGYFRLPINWAEVLKRTVHEIDADHCMGLAAQLAFYFLLALFPALLFLVALISYLPIEDVLVRLLSALGTVAPQQVVEILRGQLDQVARGNDTSLLTLGIVGAVWSSSAAMVAIIGALNRAYDVAEWRPWWKRRILAIVLTMALAVFILVSLVLVMVGPEMASRVAQWLGLAPAWTITWRIARWPAMVCCVVAGIDLVYHFAPNRRARWVWVTPGALLATVLWIVSSFGFKFYLANFADYTATYGAIGGAIVTMLWFYVCGLALLVGAELNGVIEQAWPSVAK